MTTQKILEDAYEYKHGFSTNIESDRAPLGLSADIVRYISKKRDEPQWLLDYRLKAYAHWLKMPKPEWANVNYPEINFQDICYYSSPKLKKQLDSLDDLDEEIKRTYDKLGIPIEEQKILAGVKGSTKIAVDAVFDSVSVATTYKEILKSKGIIFGSISDAVREHPELIKKYLGKVVPYTDNYYVALNSAVFTDGSFVYIPKGVRCPMELSTYFRINDINTGQFERTLIVADDDSYVSYLEGCTAPQRDENQLHAAIVEIITMDNAEVRYATVQNWYPGNKYGQGGIYNFVTKRGLCKGNNSSISWTQVETGSAITWKYPSCILKGDNSKGAFYSVTVTNGYQQADTGTKMIHIGKNTKSTIIAKGISAGKSLNTYRGKVKFSTSAQDAKNFSQCDSMMIGSESSASTVPYIENSNSSSTIEHEATTSKLSERELFYVMQRGLDREAAASLIIAGFCQPVLKNLPMEFAVEAKKLLEIILEDSNV